MLRFRKFQATGNDFIVLEVSPAGLSVGQRQRLCDRHLGIGADGIVHTEAGFFHYWNADGQEGSFCGNGARVAAWLEHERTGAREFLLQAADGPHQVRILSQQPPQIAVSLRVHTAPRALAADRWFVHTGSPHLLVAVPFEALESYPVTQVAPPLRWQTELDAGGVNVSFFAEGPDGAWHIRTYERGVEAETLSCGTACVALAAIVQGGSLSLRTRGGTLTVVREAEVYWLSGPIEETFCGEWLARS